MSDMIPQVGDEEVSLPVTFDFNGGSDGFKRTRVLWAVIAIILSTIVSLGLLTGNSGFLLNVVFCIVFVALSSTVIRFLILGEHKIRNKYIKLMEEDYKKDTTCMWKAFSVEEKYPYYVHLKGNRLVLFVQYEKDVIVGKNENDEYEHYEAVADAYNILSKNNITCFHMDYMATIGSDERITLGMQRCHEIENEGLRNILFDLYSNLQDTLENSVTTYDVYAYTFEGDNLESFWDIMQGAIACMLDGNYMGYKVLNSNDHRDLVSSLFNLETFSVNDACKVSIPSTGGITAIKLISSNGEETILNRTIAEKRAITDERNRKKEKEKVSSSKKGKKDKVEEVEINLFD